MAIAVADHVWSIGELLDAALAVAPFEQLRRRRIVGSGSW
jgi:hypothetical protein